MPTAYPRGLLAPKPLPLGYGLLNRGGMTPLMGLLASMARSAYAPIDYIGKVRRGEVDPRVDPEAAERMFDLATMTTSGAGAVPSMGFELGSGARGIRAYHGSPHDFDRFSSEHIGTGEGAQAYGHGLYFAENEGVARQYREDLSRRARNDAIDMSKVPEPPWTGEEALRMSDLAKRARKKNSNLTAEESAQLEEFSARMKAYNDAVEAAKPTIPGRMYEVEIDASPEQFLDWDKPLSEQSESVRLALARHGIENEYAEVSVVGQGRDQYYNDRYVFRSKAEAEKFAAERRAEGDVDATVHTDYDERYAPPLTGEGAYRELSGDQFDAAGRLREAGIPGIRYLDRGSRGAGDGTHNYVVFSDSIIRILRKYGLPITAGGLATLQAIAPEEAQAAMMPKGLLSGGGGF